MKKAEKYGKKIITRKLYVQLQDCNGPSEIHTKPTSTPSFCKLEQQIQYAKNTIKRKRKKKIPGADGAADADGKRSFVEIAVKERKRSSGEVAGGFNWVVGVRSKSVVAMVHLPVRTDPRFPVAFAAS